MKKLFAKIKWILTAPSRWKDEAINAGAVSFEGQGRDRYGR